MKVILLLVTAVFLQSCSFSGSAQKVKQPNVLIILDDDLKYADVGFHNSDINTPNIDKLAYSGVRLENF
ncbi:sulfatase-like hydrolase/transferase [Maribellus maritimus]|uniref:sulfatase-like hydrolase/transferase n=1 Tax=Maribellus maritimus TaxID=2870838 RepID=UPI0021D404EC|nr:sulfatase-like hydrolase/transferase [Maribellus maritimus]MCG6188320.1 sulfatase-like hydrolase/transferase [Maribellus maritimus]